MMNAIRFLAPSAAAMAAMIGSSAAPAADDGAVCARLAEAGRSGWYLRHADGALQTEPLKPLDKPFYEPGARLYFAAPGVNGAGVLRVSEGAESVWRVKMETTADVRTSARYVAVQRRLIGATGAEGNPSAGAIKRTLCQPDRDLAAFEDTPHYVDYVRYQRHHKSGADGQFTGDLHRKFHLEVKNRLQPNASGRNCIFTDDPAAEENLQSAYNFEDVGLTTLDVAASFVAPSSAQAATVDNKVAGYNSEIVYIRGPGLVCFGVAAPTPTTTANSVDMRQLVSWRPIKTTIELRQVLSLHGDPQFSWEAQMRQWPNLLKMKMSWSSTSTR